MDKVIYVKYSDDRADRYKISTSIVEDAAGNRVVYKKPENEASAAHIHNIYDNYKKLKDFFCSNPVFESCKVNESVLNGDELRLEYLTGESYQKKLSDIYSNDGADAIIPYIDQYVNKLRSAATGEFVITDNFRRIFGEYEGLKGEKSLGITDIDFNFDNIILNDYFNIIDYEWVYDFPIPVDFVIYRALNYLAMEIRGIEGNPYEYFEALAARYDIGNEKIEKYNKMEQSFLRHVNGSAVTLREMFYKIGKKRPTLYDLLTVYNKEYDSLYFQIYYDYGNGYEDEQIVHVTRDEQEYINISVPVKENAIAVRVDPGSNYCVAIVDESSIPFTSNGYNLNNKTIGFKTDDPQIYFNNIDKVCKNIIMKLRLVVLNEELSRNFIEIVDYIVKRWGNDTSELKEQLTQKDGNISTLNTTICGLEGEIKRLQLENERVIEENRNKSSQMTVLNNTIQQLNNEVAIKSRECERYVNSGSWKVTAPLRGIRKFALKYLNNRYTRQFGRGIRSLRSSGVRKTFVKVKWWIKKKQGAHTVTIGDFIAMPGVTADILSDVPELMNLNKTIAVQLHLYYEELLDEFCQYLGNIPFAFDLYISCREQANANKIRRRALKIRNVSKVVVKQVPNRGRDIAPIFVWFAQDLEKYDYMIHMHSKKSLYTGSEKLGWRQYSLDSLLGEERLVRKYFGVLESSNVGLVYPDNHEDVPALANTWLSNESDGRKLLAQFGIPFETGFFNYPVGSFYIAKVEAVRSLFERRFSIEDFPEESGQTDGTLAHAIERGIVFFAKQKNMTSAIVDYRENALRYEWSYKAFRPHFNNKKQGVLQHLMQFDVISFDIFDTLITRMVLRPDDVFTIMKKKLKETYKIECDFLSLRKQAEALAFREKGWYTNIHDIYKMLPDVMDISLEQAENFKQMEIDLEYELCIPRRDVLEVFNALKQSNKKIILVSDMYLTKELIERMLRKCGYDGWTEMYVSCENGMRKDCNTVWDEIGRIYGSSLVHIGDNPRSDWQTVVDRHIESFWVFNPLDAFKFDSSYQTLKDLMNSDLRAEDSIVLGMLINGALYNSPWNFDASSGCIQMTDAWTMGYTCFGPIFTNYIKNIDEIAADDQILLFLAREGYILQKLYKEYHAVTGVPEKRNYYFEASRRCVTVAASKTEQDIKEVIGQNYGGALSNLVRSRLGFELPEGVEDRRIDLSPRETGLIDGVMKLLEPYKEEMYAQFEQERKAYLQYIQSIATDDEWNKFMVLDVGYSGTIQYFLSKLLDTKISGYYLATFSTKPDKIGCKVGAVYDKNYKKIAVIDHTQLFLEAALQAPYGQLVKCELSGDGVEFVHKKEEYIKPEVLELQKGILDFCHQFGGMVSMLDNNFGDVDDIIMRMHELFLHGRFMTYEMADVYSVEDDYCSNKTLSFIKDMDRWNNF